jgi:hypothetical protein
MILVWNKRFAIDLLVYLRRAACRFKVPQIEGSNGRPGIASTIVGLAVPQPIFVNRRLCSLKEGPGQQHTDTIHHVQTKQKAKYELPKSGSNTLIDAGIEPAIS